VTDNDLLPLLEHRLRGVYSSLLADVDATLLLSAGGIANWTVEFKVGRASARAGRPTRPTTTVTGRLDTLFDVVSGQASGIAAFLDQRIAVRGNLALALMLDGLFPGPVDDVTRTQARSVRVSGLDTFYLESGPPDAPTVVLVHGLGATNASVLPLIPALSDRYRVVAPDLPGHGGTQATGADHAARFLGDWLLEFVRATCPRPPVLVGNSLGGRTALEAALNAPAEFAGLVALCPAVAFRKLRQLVPVVRMVPDEVAALAVRFPRTLAMRGLRQLFADDSRLPVPWYEATIDEFVRITGNRANRLAAFSALRHIYLDEPFGQGGFWERLPALRPPALFVWGDRDVLVPVGFARFVEQALPSVRSVVLSDCGHVPQFEHPTLTSRLVREFLDSVWAADVDEPARELRRHGG
jgi:pimeloyl-ACP methyl ester carboxylesterase/putative sterol carrier protein